MKTLFYVKDSTDSLEFIVNVENIVYFQKVSDSVYEMIQMIGGNPYIKKETMLDIINNTPELWVHLDRVYYHNGEVYINKKHISHIDLVDYEERITRKIFKFNLGDVYVICSEANCSLEKFYQAIIQSNPYI